MQTTTIIDFLGRWLRALRAVAKALWRAGDWKPAIPPHSSNHAPILPASSARANGPRVTFASVLSYGSSGHHAEVRNIFEGVVEAVPEIRHADGQGQLDDLSFWSSAGFSLWGFVLAWTKTHRLKPALPNAPTIERLFGAC